MKWYFAAPLALLVTAGAGLAQSAQDQIIAQLKAQGFTRIEIERTWLGRLQIEAKAPGIEREIILNPNTGEILRDYWERDDDDDDDDDDHDAGVLNPSSHRGGDEDGDHDDDDDDIDDDDDEDDDDEDDDSDDDDDGDDDDDAD